MSAQDEAVNRAYRIVNVFVDAERRQRDAAQMRAWIEKRNKENWR